MCCCSVQVFIRSCSNLNKDFQAEVNTELLCVTYMNLKKPVMVLIRVLVVSCNNIRGKRTFIYFLHVRKQHTQTICWLLLNLSVFAILWGWRLNLDHRKLVACHCLKLNTRGAFPAAKIRKEGFRKVFNVWNKSLFSNFEVGWKTFPWSRKCLSVVLKTDTND